MCTDTDEAQYQRKISDDLYEMYGVTEVSLTEYHVDHMLIRISNLVRNPRYVRSLLGLYGYDGDGNWRDILQSYGIMPEWCDSLLAEMAFECSVTQSDDGRVFKTFDDAEHEVLRMIDA